MNYTETSSENVKTRFTAYAVFTDTLIAGTSTELDYNGEVLNNYLTDSWNLTLGKHPITGL